MKVQMFIMIKKKKLHQLNVLNNIGKIINDCSKCHLDINLNIFGKKFRRFKKLIIKLKITSPGT